MYIYYIKTLVSYVQHFSDKESPCFVSCMILCTQMHIQYSYIIPATHQRVGNSNGTCPRTNSNLNMHNM